MDFSNFVLQDRDRLNKQLIICTIILKDDCWKTINLIYFTLEGFVQVSIVTTAEQRLDNVSC